MDLLSGLNPQQRDAVAAPPGPTLVLAGPGSGKTRVLTHRIAYLINHLGVPPYRIMAVTFTNKAANEMKTRVEALLEGRLRGLTIGTFHSICARLLRRESKLLPVTNEFVIFDTSDQEALVKQVLQELNLDDKKFRPPSLLSKISAAKNELIGPEEFAAGTYAAEIIKRVYRRYQELLVANNALDFDDLLVTLVELFRQYPEVLEKYQRTFDHVLVDEFQDTNTVQYALLKHIVSKHRNLYAVGDPDQCFTKGTLIHTPFGPKPIEQMKPGDQVIAASGRGASMPAEVRHIESRAYEGQIVHVITRRGCSFRATPNHIIFARLGISTDVHYVYLMHQKRLGYRIGVVVGARSDGESPEPQIGLRVRGNAEVADRIWLLRVCPTRDEAYYWEAFYAFQYGIPTTVFHVRGRRMRMNQAAIDRLYQSINTHERAERLLTDLGMSTDFPHYIPKAKLLRHVVNLRYFGDARRTEKTPWNAHRISVCSSDVGLKELFEARGYFTRRSRKKTWRTEFSRLQYEDAQAIARELSRSGGGLEIVTGAFLVNSPGELPARRFSLMPAGHLHPSMIVAVECDGHILEDEISEVRWETYRGNVYDLEVACLHNYIAGGVVVHNSIYRWRGADYRNVRRFQEDFPNARTILLEQNYRSTQIILDAAMAVIDRHPGRTRKQLFTERRGGVEIFVYEAYNEAEEGQFVVDTIAELVRKKKYKPGDVAVMYRTNAQSRAVEEAFIRANLPYKLIGAQRFYGRKEIKDLLSYLRLVHNPADTVSLARVINVPPRGIGGKTLEQLNAAAQSAGVTPADILRDLADPANGPRSVYAAQFGGKAGAALVSFGKLLNYWSVVRGELSVVQLMDVILDRTGYRDYLQDGTEEGQERWANVLELRGVAAENPEITLQDFLQNVALVSDQDTVTEEGQAPILLTLHAAKGLEFPIVFLLGLDEGVLPHQRSFDDPEAMHEERRLMYVGMTRAKDRLYLLRAFRRSLYGDSSLAEPSRFLEEIPDHLLAGNRPIKAMNAQRMYQRATSWDEAVPNTRQGRSFNLSTQNPKSRASVPNPKFKTGQRVKHASFGEGVVVESKMFGGDEEVVVAFEAVGVKRLAANVAKLEVIKG